MILERYEVDQLAQRLKQRAELAQSAGSVEVSPELIKDLKIASAIIYAAGRHLVGGHGFGPGEKQLEITY